MAILSANEKCWADFISHFESKGFIFRNKFKDMLIHVLRLDIRQFVSKEHIAGYLVTLLTPFWKMDLFQKDSKELVLKAGRTLFTRYKDLKEESQFSLQLLNGAKAALMFHLIRNLRNKSLYLLEIDQIVRIDPNLVFKNKGIEIPIHITQILGIINDRRPLNEKLSNLRSSILDISIFSEIGHFIYAENESEASYIRIQEKNPLSEAHNDYWFIKQGNSYLYLSDEDRWEISGSQSTNENEALS